MVAAAAASDDSPPTVPAWHGTILPRTDGDVWLAAAFAEYEHIAALENAYRQRAADGKLSDSERDRLSLDLNSYRTAFTEGSGCVLAVRRSAADDRWYRLAAGKGVCVLHELRQRLSPPVFDAAADSFGRQFAGKEVSTADFQTHLETASGKKLGEFFDYWVGGHDLPRVEFADVGPMKEGHGVSGRVKRSGPTRDKVSITVRLRDSEITREFAFVGNEAPFQILCSEAPRSIVIDGCGDTALSEGRRVSVQSLHHELDETLIVYGTQGEEAANRDAAVELQRALRSQRAEHHGADPGRPRHDTCRMGEPESAADRPTRNKQRDSAPERVGTVALGRTLLHGSGRYICQCPECGSLRGAARRPARGRGHGWARRGIDLVGRRAVLVRGGKGRDRGRAAARRSGGAQLVMPKRGPKQYVEFAHSP